MALDQKDLELIERVIYKNGDDIAVSIGRSFERLVGMGCHILGHTWRVLQGHIGPPVQYVIQLLERSPADGNFFPFRFG